MPDENNPVSLARTHIAAGRHADAVALLQPHLAEHPDDPAGLSLLGVAYSKLGKWEEAAETARALVDLRKDDATAWSNWGMALRKLGRASEAKKAQAKALALDPAHKNATVELAKLRRDEAASLPPVRSTVFCDKCGYAMTPFDAECPRCKRMGFAEKLDPPAKRRDTPDDTEYPPLETPVSPAQHWALRRTTAPPAAPSSTPTETNPGLGAVAFLAALGAVALAGWFTGGIGSLALVVATSIWMAIDAASLETRGNRVGNQGAAMWAVCGLALWIVAMPWYIVARDRHLRQNGIYKPLTGLYIASAAGIGASLVLAFMVGLSLGLGALPDIGGTGGANNTAPAGVGSTPAFDLSGSGQTCPYCRGEGSSVCTFCNGHGVETCAGCSGEGTIGYGEYAQTCPVCGGSGRTNCMLCSGTGWVDCPMCVDGKLP